jgi:predicted 2-oxoglutarate/Fe(II)-dependent dioxygenase YbiX
MKNFKTVADGVMKLDNFFPKALCERVMKYSDKMCTKTLNTVDMLGPEYRNVLGYSLKNTLVSDIIYFKYIQEVITQAYAHYRIKWPSCFTSKIKQMDLFKYHKGHHYSTHIDHSNLTQRTLAVSINLNEDYEGGDLVYFYQDWKEEMARFKLKQGSIVFHPASFQYPHQIESITKGTRYSIVSWLI